MSAGGTAHLQDGVELAWAVFLLPLWKPTARSSWRPLCWGPPASWQVQLGW